MAPAIHLHPTAPLAPRVLLPGDPGRALALAQALLKDPKMFNHNRGLWGYTGTALDGSPLSVQSTGMGGPSAAIVISELIELGAQRLLRVGTCGALVESLSLGDLVVAVEAMGADGTSRALGVDGHIAPTADLAARLREVQAGAGVTAVSTDLFYEHREELPQQWQAAGAQVVEMESAALYALAHRHGVDAASLLIVSDRVIPARARLDPEALRAAEVRAGQLALAALAQ
jgi:DeoD family purine-nucleoside phosphorylase